jgi:hypothetical protein
MPVEMCGLDDVRHEIAYSIQDAPPDYIDRHIVQAAIRIARDLRAIRRTVKVDMQVGVKDYYPAPIKGERWFALRSLKVCGRCIDVGNEPLCTDVRCNACIPGYGYFKGPCGIILDRPPKADVERAIEIEMIAIPELDACELDCAFVETYTEGIQSLAEAMMRKHKGRNGKEVHSWYDPALSMDLMRTFEKDLMGRYKNDYLRNYHSEEFSVGFGLPG